MMRTGRVQIDDAGNELFYRLFGKGDSTLVCLHGGPGQGHGYLEALGRICDAVDGLQVLMYDQLGAGQSDPGTNIRWSPDRYVGELEEVRKRLGLGSIHLYGHSWGGMIAMQYAIEKGDRVRSLILSNTSADMAKVMSSIQRLQTELPKQHYKNLVRAVSGVPIEREELQDSVLEFNARYLRRETPFDPHGSKAAFKRVFPAPRESYGPSFKGLWGNDPFDCRCMPCSGPLLDWSVEADLTKIAAPTLILCGLFDEISPELHRTLAERIPNNEFVIFGNSSHFVLQEKESELYVAVVGNFLKRMVAGA